MALTERKTAPFSLDESDQLAAFVTLGTAEHEALEGVSPVPLRAGSEGSVIRALALVGMASIRRRLDAGQVLAEGYDALATSRGETDRATAAGMRRNMTRLAERG